MRVSRRTLLKASAASAAAASSPALGKSRPALAVFDGASPESVRFAKALPCPAIDVAAEHAGNWRAFRAALPSGRIFGLTRWTDLVLARGYAEEQGKRLHVEERRGPLFLWELA